MKILFLHEVGYLQKPIFEMHEFPEHLASRGHEVAFADYPEGGGRRLGSSFGDIITGRVLSSVSLKLYSQSVTFPGLLGRLAAVIFFPIFFNKVLSHFKPDVVVSFAVPTSGWQAAIICNAKGTPLLFRALDVSHKIRKSAFAPLIKIAERFVYSRAAWVSCNNPAMLEYCLSLGAKEFASSVEYPPLDVSHFRPLKSQKAIRNELGIRLDSQVIVYMGSFFYFSGLTQVLRDLALLELKPTLLLIGGGEQDSELRAVTKDLGLEDWVKFTGFVDFEDLSKYLSIGDVAINPMVRSLVSNKALPNKVLQYMASGLPVVTTELEGLSSIFGGEVGVQSVPDASKVLTHAVALLRNDELAQLGNQNRKAVSRKFDTNFAVRNLEDRLEALRSQT